MSNFKAHLTDIRQQARTLIGEPHVSTDIRSVIEDLLGVIQELERQINSAEGMGGDVRVLRSRVKQLTTDLSNKDREVTDFKKKFLDPLVIEIKNITTEVSIISFATQSEPTSTVQTSARAISKSLKTLVEALSKT
jgi:myo-inositol-1-phosphate synthase